jgi:hypothetical protein
MTWILSEDGVATHLQTGAQLRPVFGGYWAGTKMYEVHLHVWRNGDEYRIRLGVVEALGSPDQLLGEDARVLKNHARWVITSLAVASTPGSVVSLGQVASEYKDLLRVQPPGGDVTDFAGKNWDCDGRRRTSRRGGS